MSASPALEKQNAPVGIPSGKKREIAYRTGMVIQVIGAAVLAVLYPMGSPFYSAGIMLFELGALLSGICILIWISWIKKLVLGSILIGILLQLIGFLAVPPEHAISVIIAGIGFVCAGAAGMAGKEAYCFGYREGWILVWLFPIIIIVNLFGKISITVNSLGFSSLFLLLLSLVGKMLKQPLLSKGAALDCAPPQS